MEDNPDRGSDYVQYGASLSMNNLSKEKEAEIIERMRAAGIDVGGAPGDGEYIVNIDENRL